MEEMLELDLEIYRLSVEHMEQQIHETAELMNLEMYRLLVEHMEQQTWKIAELIYQHVEEG